MILFPDISKWQGAPDFDVMKSKTDYVILRAGQRSYTDYQFLRSRDECIRVGLAWGTYWFYDGRASPGSQAQYLFNLLQGFPQPVEIFCDWERKYEGDWEGLKNVVSFMERLEELTGREVGMYTGYYWFAGNSNQFTHASQYRYLQDKLLWLAWYTKDFTNTGIEQVKIPKPWLEMDIWQYGTPLLAHEYGVSDSIEIDMNERLGVINLPNLKRNMTAVFGNKRILYEEV